VGIELIFNEIELALIEEACTQSQDGTLMKKRKGSTGREKDSILFSDDTESYDMMFVEGKVVGREKRVKFQDDG